MYQREDTIVAVATPPGRSALAVVRLSGNNALEIINTFFKIKSSKSSGLKKNPRTAQYGFIHDQTDNIVLDEVIVLYFPAPHSYSGEDLIEISCHGNPLILDHLVKLSLNHGARLALPGEFTFRAYMNGRIDLTQAEAVIDLINARSEQALKQSIKQLEGRLSKNIEAIHNELKSIYSQYVLAIDFPEEDVPELEVASILSTLERIQVKLETLLSSIPTSIVVKEGYTIPIVGVPNVGKSSLLNYFLDKDRAIVTNQPGTTRDTIEEYIHFKGHLIKLIDTAGIRDTSDLIESEGVKRTLSVIKQAHILIVLLEPEAQQPQSVLTFLSKTEHLPRILAYNKIDLINPESLPDILNDEKLLKISVLEQSGFDCLQKTLFDIITSQQKDIVSENNENQPRLTNTRQKNACQKTYNAVIRSIESIRQQIPEDMIAFEVEQALNELNEIVGKTTPDDILEDIFTKFCIGK